MCLICLEFELGKNRKMTIEEARKNFSEISLTVDKEHRQEVLDMLDKAEEDELMDQYWEWLFLIDEASD